MVKKADLVVVDLNARAPALFEIGDAEQALAVHFGVDLAADAETLVRLAKANSVSAMVEIVQMGLRLMAAKTSAADARRPFEELLADYGLGERRAQEAMQLARAVAAEGSARNRDVLLEMGKSKALQFLGAAQDVREKIMSSPEMMADMLEGSTRDFEAQINKLKDEVESLQNATQARTSQQDVEAQGHIVTPDIPYEVSDIRRETAALYKQADLAVAAMADLGPMLLDLQGSDKMDKWLVPTATQAYTAMQGLQAKLAVQLAAWRDTFALEVDGLPPITDAAFYQPEEAVLVATHFDALLGTHLAEGKRRADQRANAAPGKLGRKRKVG